MDKGSSFFHRFKFTVTISMTILILSLLPGSSIPKISWSDLISIDKWAHFVMYGTMAFVWSYEWIPTAEKDDRSKYFRILVITALYGILLESLQLILNSDRYFEVLDIIANIIGSMAGLLAYHWLIKK